MKKPAIPLRINLLEIGPEGMSYHFTKESGELSEVLAPVLGSNPYSVAVELHPMGNIFSISGTWETNMNLICARCALDFSQPAQAKFNELIVIEEDRPRTGKSAKVNHTSDTDPDAPFCNYLQNPWFDLGAFIYEQIVSNEPVQPSGCQDLGDACPNFQEAIGNGWISKQEPPPAPETPFSILKDFKLQ